MTVVRLASGAALLVLCLCGPASAQVKYASAAREAPAFDAARLEQIAAPIALYPDALLTQVMMAATYPVEVVEAARWVREHPDQSGQALQDAISNEPWDPSVKALVGVPEALNKLSDNLDWTRDLGDAFLSQRSALMDAVQRLRARARDAGTLATTQQETVQAEPSGIIEIESADPQVVYVPEYSPFAVYGTGWNYPYWYYPGFYYPGYWRYPGFGLAFSTGYNWGNWFWGGATWGWGTSDIWVDSGRYDRFNQTWNRRFWRGGTVAQGRQAWTHDSAHRDGVRYRDPAIARQYGAADRVVTRDEARGWPRTTTVTPPRTDGFRTRQGVNAPVTPREEPRVVGAPERRAPEVPRVPQVERAPEVQRTPQYRPSSSWRGSSNPHLERQVIQRSRSSPRSAGSGHGNRKGE